MKYTLDFANNYVLGIQFRKVSAYISETVLAFGEKYRKCGKVKLLEIILK